MSTLSREDALKLVAKARSENGGISPEAREKARKDFPEILDALANVRRQLAGSMKLLVDQLYSKETRFIYELIQNAEDNSYDIAARPSLTFRVFADRIIIDSNEDGFHEENVKAICKINASTKANAEGYIGEKGIGFKSVFKIAGKVHIQSGPFSFFFEHLRGAGDDGLGMVTPLDGKFEDLPPGVRTRMTLILLGSIELERLMQDFRDIPDTLLLFLRTLENLTIELHPRGAERTSVTYSKNENQVGGQLTTTLTKLASEGSRNSISRQKFYIVRRRIQGLPYDEARKNIDHATIILAFPVDEKEVPVVKQQHVFAFLPLRQAGFQFLIQSDFITQANREDVVRSARNRAILKGVAEAFRDAVVQFCQNPSLCYQWMRYLPSDSIPDDFWGSLWPMMRELLKNTKIVKSWSENGLHFPPSLSKLDLLDKNGEPLFPDLPEERYLSRRYSKDDWSMLQRIGAIVYNWGHVIEHLRADLASPSSRWKSLTSDQDWRTRVCNMLLQAFNSGNTFKQTQESMKSLDLVLLQGGKWVSARAMSIYFPNTKGILIPTDLGLTMVQTATTTNQTWRKLQSHLGVTDCPSESVISAISRRYKNAQSIISLDNSIAHLRYLYWNLPEGSQALDRNIWLLDQNKGAVPSTKFLYFDISGDEHNPADIFKASQNLPGFNAHLLHPDYVKAETGTRSDNSWLSWLETVAGVRRNPQLCGKGSTDLSAEFLYLINHRSEIVLWILKRFWSNYEQQVRHVEKILRDRQFKVEGNSRLMLSSTFLPLPKLENLVREHRIPNFPFIQMSPLPHDEEKGDWEFLRRFEVGIDDSVGFFLRAIECLSQVKRTADQSSMQDVVCLLYDKVQKQCRENTGLVCERFNTVPLVHVPDVNSGDGVWVVAKDCIWEGPEWLRSKRRLNIPDYRSLDVLFKSILSIPDASLSDILADLSKIRNEGYANVTAVERIYDHLWRISSTFEDDHRKQLRDEFERSKLIYMQHLTAWFRPSACVWADSHVEIPGKVSIATAFKLKKTFFTRLLKVEEPSIAMYIASIKSLASRNSPAAKIREAMKLVSLLGVEEADVSSLLDAKVFPVKCRNGQMCFMKAKFTSPDPEFAIMDNLTHGDAFQGKIDVLDMSLEEIRDARPFLLACGLEHHFMSRLIKEETTVQEGSLEWETTKEFRLKAPALVRCATHFTTPDKRREPRLLQRLFSQASVFVSDSINRSVRVRLKNQVIEGGRSTANFHLDESEDRLRLYLPRDEVKRAICLERQLPRRLLAFLKITDQAAEGVIGGVFRNSKLAVVDGILHDAGVAPMVLEDIKQQEEQPEDQLQAEADQRQLLLEDTRQPKVQSEALASQQQEFQHMSLTAQAHSPPRIPSTSQTLVTPNRTPNLLIPTSGQARPVQSNELELAYTEILDNVIVTAKERITTDVFGTPGSFIPRNGLPQAVIKQASGTRSIDRDRRVGAAGELYVFQYLRGLNLARFGMDNWKSIIRDYVASHEDYRDIERWSGSGIADIEYQDVEGQLTQHLIKKGYLERDLWINEHPYYCFEVKTTTSSDWREPFYMSRAQYNHVQDMKLQEGITAPRIYVVIRIHGLGTGTGTGVSVYIDPETMKQKGALLFRPDTWTVTPDWGSSDPKYSFWDRVESVLAQTPSQLSQHALVLRGRDISGGSATAGTQPSTVPVNAQSTPSIFGQAPSAGIGSANTSSPSNGLNAINLAAPTNNGTSQSLFGTSLTAAASNSSTQRPASAPGLFTVPSSTSNQSTPSASRPSLATSTSDARTSRTSQPSPSPSQDATTRRPLFGANSSTTGGGLFNSSNTQSTSGMSLFGSASSSTGGGLFGSSNTQSSNTQSTSERPLFGTGSTSTVGLFGGSSTQGTNRNSLHGNSSSTTGGGLFSTSNAQGTSGSSLFRGGPPSTGGLSGSPNTQSTNRQSTFGTSSSTSSGGLFGSSNAQSTNGQSLFGTSASSTGGGLFGTPNTQGTNGNQSFSGTAGPFGSPTSTGSQPRIEAGSALGQERPAFGNLTPSSQTSSTGAFSGSGGFGRSATPSSSQGSNSQPTPTAFGGFGSFGKITGSSSGNNNPPTASSAFGGFRSNTSSAFGGNTGRAFGTGPSLGFGNGANLTSGGNSSSGFGSSKTTGFGGFSVKNPPSYSEDIFGLRGTLPYVEKENNTNIWARYQTITFDPSLKDYSFEELRLADYKSGSRYCTWVRARFGL